MLESFSWSQFLRVVAVFIGCYYAVIGCLFWRDLIALFRNRRAKVLVEPSNLMGPSRHTFERNGAREVSGETLVVAPGSRDDEPPIDLAPEHRMLKLRDELLVEAGILLKVGVRTTLPETAELFQVLFSHYPFFIGTPYQEEISASVVAAFAEHTSFSVTLEEVLSWWTSNQQRYEKN